MTSNPVVTPTEADELIRWHQMCANMSARTDDFAGARWHREKLAQWQAWRGGKRGFPNETKAEPISGKCTSCDGRGWHSWEGIEGVFTDTCLICNGTGSVVKTKPE